jgi:hypothetical protein
MILWRKNILLLVLSALVLSSCIEPFPPNLGNETVQKFVVFGQITDKEGYQIVSVSTTSTIKKPKYNPLSFCTVSITDNQENTFFLNEFEPGNYRVWIGQDYLYHGNSFRVNVTTPTGIQIISNFDEMPEGPDIDSIYYIRKDIPTTNPDKPLQGIQFYLNLDGKNTNCHFYRWDIIETWEHHAVFPKSLYWNMKNVVIINPSDFSRMYCWTTQDLQKIYTLSTENLSQNTFRMYKLHFVDNTTQRLTYCYSLLINQYTLSREAYTYWNNLRINSNEQGGLYEIQPLHVIGNLRCTSNPELEVLGFFSATSLSTKRIFVRNVQNLDILYPNCHHGPAGRLDKSAPVYLMMIDGEMEALEDDCVECDKHGGSTVKPDFWPY